MKKQVARKRAKKKIGIHGKESKMADEAPLPKEREEKKRRFSSARSKKRA